MAAPTSVMTGLARRLVIENVISENVANDAVAAAAREQVRLTAYLVGKGLAKPMEIARAASAEFGDPVFDLSALDLSQIPKNLIEEKLARKHGCLPIYQRGRRVFIALTDPTDQAALRDIAFTTQLNPVSILVEEDKLQATLDTLFKSMSSLIGDGADDSYGDIEFEAGGEEEGGEEEATRAAEDDAPVVRFIQKMLLDAVAAGASDLHFEPYEKTYRVRFRIDGVLREIARPPVQLSKNLSSRLKVMSKLNIAERRLPQDGRIKLKLRGGHSIDFRVSSLPTLYGEKLVLRILDSSSAKLGIDALGYEPDQKALYLEALEKPQGLLLITGPTGSGKTVSLYTGINILNQPDTNISTAEDPVEINLEGVNQVNVDNKVGLTFASALKSFLRQDPDVIMVGEIRDLETAEIAVKAAQTGHLVLSTLHTNSAPETLTRLRNMGVPSFNVATSVNLVIAQRLARRLCPECRKPQQVPIESLRQVGFREEDIAKGFQLYEPGSCSKCKDGYKGRVGIYEVMKVTPAIQRIIMEEGNSILIADQARKEGFDDLRRSGLKKAMAGVTSLHEVLRVTTD